MRPAIDIISRAQPEQLTSRGELAQFVVLIFTTLMIAGPSVYQMIHSSGAFFPSDYQLHIGLIQKALQDGSWQPHFLYQWTVYALSGFHSEFEPLATATLVVALLSLIAKICLTHLVYLSTLTTGRGGEGGQFTILPASNILLLTLISSVLMPLLNPFLTGGTYLGKVAPNIWHNPTSLLAWPFVILLFFAAYDYLDRTPAGIPIYLGALFVVNALAKPNYVLALAPVFFFACLARFGLSKRFAISQFALLPV
jgi:hypothetical protein